MTDDLFDYIGDPARIGKGIRTDLPDGKVTLPLIRGLAGAGTRDRLRLRELAARKDPGPEGWARPPHASWIGPGLSIPAATRPAPWPGSAW